MAASSNARLLGLARDGRHGGADGSMDDRSTISKTLDSTTRVTRDEVDGGWTSRLNYFGDDGQPILWALFVEPSGMGCGASMNDRSWESPD